MSVAVFVELAPNPGERHELGEGATIGREGCDVVLEDPEVSRRHAIVRLGPAGPAIEDLGSRNGTFVNDRQIDALAPLMAADTVRFGAVVWRFETAPAAETAIARPAEPISAPAPTPAPPAEPTPATSETPSVQSAPPEPPATPPAPMPSVAAVRSAVSGARGDVPPPPDLAASAVHGRPASPPTSAPVFATGASAPAPRRASAARSGTATLASLIVVALTAVALAIYFGARDEEPDSGSDRPPQEQPQSSRDQGEGTVAGG